MNKLMTLAAVAASAAIPMAANADNPKWTLKVSNTANNGWEDSTCIWVDENGGEHTWDSSSAIDYIVPAGFDLRTRYDNSTGGATRTFSSNPATTVTFVGAATESGRGRFIIKSKIVIVPNLIAGDWTMICFGNHKSDSYANHDLRGGIRVDTLPSAPARIRAHANNNSVQTVSAAISGTGALLVFPENRNAQKAGKIVLSGNNSDYLGNVIVASDNQSTMTLSVSSSTNLGGNPASLTQGGVELGSKATLEVSGDVALGSNRGFYVSENSTVSVASGKTFSVPSAITFGTGKSLSKTGAGTFSLSGADLSGWVSEGTIAVNAGTLELGATVAGGAVTPTAVGAFTLGSGVVNVCISGDGSELAYNTSYTLLTSANGFPSGFENAVSATISPGAFTLPAGAVATYSVVDGDKYVMVVGPYSGDPVWIGGGADVNFSTTDNWLGGIAPTANSAAPLAFAAEYAATITNDIAGLAPVSVTFRAGCETLAICGNALSIPQSGAITNNSINTPVINAAVTFGDEIDVTGNVNFAGGVTGTQPVNHTTYRGKYTLTADAWTPPEGSVVPSGSEIRTQNALVNAQGLTIQSGGAVYAGSLTRRYDGDAGSRNHQLYGNAGTLSVGEMRWTGYISSTSANASFFPVYSGSGRVVFRTGKLVNGVLAGNGTKQAIVYLGNGGWEDVFVIGEGGMTFEKPEGVETMYSQYQLQDNVTVTLAPTADWCLHENLASINRRGIYLASGVTLNISTTDYDDSSKPHTITLKGLILDGRNSTINITGIGTALYKYSNHQDSYGLMYSGALNVRDSATFAFDSGCSLGAATFSFAGTSTLKVAQSGTVALGGNLTLGATASLAFNFTDKVTAPRLAIPAASTIPATVNLKISADEGIRPSSSRTHSLTSTYDFTGKAVNLIDPPKWVKSVDVVGGNIVLTAKPKGLMVFVK